MDTVQEESSPLNSPTTSDDPRVQFLYPGISVHGVDGHHKHHDDMGPTEIVRSPSQSSRRPSAIIAALRRPSQSLALSAAQAVMNQRKLMLSFFQGHDRNLDNHSESDKEDMIKQYNKKLGNDALTTVLSALYAKLLVVLGMAFPITEIISDKVRPFFYQGFYLYLYLGSIAFIAFMYATLVKKKAVFSIIKASGGRKDTESDNDSEEDEEHHHEMVRYGSFYLRVGAIAFGIGSMVYSGLEFGRYFELRNDTDCPSNALQAITPAMRMILTIGQIQFIFLNSKDLEVNQHKVIARFGLMHMLATNLCEWLYVLIEETKHEIIHLSKHNNATSDLHEKYCQEGNVMGSLVTNASPFLFPCTIEYSLICAVILFEMWKEVKSVKETPEENKPKTPPNYNKLTSLFHFSPFGGPPVQSAHHFTVDCSNSHKGLFGGILLIVLTIISMIMFFVLTNEEGTPEEKHKFKSMAEFEVNIVELVLYIITTLACVVAKLRMRDMRYTKKEEEGIGLDNTLLVVAQTGVFIYCMFSIISSYFTIGEQSAIGLFAEIFSFIQTCLQTMLVLDGWWRRCRNLDQTKNKPGRELITFLIIANMGMWTINALEKNRAEFRTMHLKFYGDWAWTIITHISMPLAIFYRFHSTICLFEVWKNAYKIKTRHRSTH